MTLFLGVFSIYAPTGAYPAELGRGGRLFIAPGGFPHWMIAQDKLGRLRGRSNFEPHHC